MKQKSKHTLAFALMFTSSFADFAIATKSAVTTNCVVIVYFWYCCCDETLQMCRLPLCRRRCRPKNERFFIEASIVSVTTARQYAGRQSPTEVACRRFNAMGRTIPQGDCPQPANNNCFCAGGGVRGWCGGGMGRTAWRISEWDSAAATTRAGRASSHLRAAGGQVYSVACCRPGPARPSQTVLQHDRHATFICNG